MIKVWLGIREIPFPGEWGGGGVLEGGGGRGKRKSLRNGLDFWPCICHYISTTKNGGEQIVPKDRSSAEG